MTSTGLHPDLVLLNATIVEAGSPVRSAQGIAMRDGRIRLVSDSRSLEEFAGPQTRTIDLDGAVIIPGLIDAHNHLLMTGTLLNQVQLYDCRSIADIKQRVGASVRTVPPGTWIVGRGWDESLLAEGRHPNRHDLDEIAPDHPVVIHRVWNRLVANSRALELAGINRETPDPPANQPYAGGFERDESGHPTGLFRDRAKDLITTAIPAPSLDELVESIATGCREYNRLGITAVSEPGLTPIQMRAFHVAEQRGLLTVRTAMSIAGWGFGSSDEDALIQARLENLGVEGGFGTDRLWIDGVKLMPDGGIGDRTARMYEGYLGEPENHGSWTVDPGDLVNDIRWAHDHGFAMDIHTCGDEAQEVCVQAFAEAQTANPQPHLRHRVHHAYLPTARTLDLMAQHQIPAVVSNPFLWSLGESYRLSLGDDRAGRMMPMRSYLDRGVPLAGSSDSPVASHNPWIGLAAAIDRTTVNGFQLGPDQCLTPDEALAMYTTGGAFVLNRAGITGQLAPGSVADLVVLDADPRGMSPAELRNCHPIATLVNGQIVSGELG